MELQERFARGDLDAFEELFRQFQPEVFAWTVRIVRDGDMAEELTVETFWRIYQARSRFDPKRSFGAWARRIATNAAIDHLKKIRRELPLPDAIEQPAKPDATLNRELAESIRIAFCSLPAKLQATAALALIEEQPYQEIAESLGTSVGTVKSRVFRATRLLRQELERLGIKP